MHFVRACCVRGPTPRGRAPFLGLSGLRALGLVWRAASRMRPSLVHFCDCGVEAAEENPLNK